MSTNVFLRDLDLEVFNHLDGRRLEVVADGLSLFGGAQLATDSTLVSAMRRDGTARRGAANRNGVAIQATHRCKERTYPELVGEGCRARLVTLAGKVGGRWSIETANFFRARDAPNFLQASAEVPWFRRWSSILSCAAARAFADSLLDVRVADETFLLPMMLSGTTGFDALTDACSGSCCCVVVCDLVVH